MADGTELPADLVVYATGYGSMNGWAADLISQEVADKVGKVWGLGSDTAKDPGPWEGEQRNMWKPTQQRGAVVPRRQPAPVAPLLALPRAPAQGARGGHRHARLRPPGGPPPQLRPGHTGGAAPGSEWMRVRKSVKPLVERSPRANSTWSAFLRPRGVTGRMQ